MIKINIADFFRTGRFGPIKLGMTRKEIIAQLGEPDQYGCPGEKGFMKAGIWLYGDIEFHIDERQRLWLIWCDHIPFPGTRSKRVDLDAWFFSRKRAIPKKTVLDELNRSHIPYTLIKLEEKEPGGEIMMYPGYFVSCSVTEYLRFDSGVVIGIGELEKTFYSGKKKPEIKKDYVILLSLSKIRQG